MVDIIIGAIPPVQNNLAQHEKSGKRTPKKKVLKEKRKNRADRRQGGRNCDVVVTLSKYPDRRKNAGRRKNHL